MIRFILPVIIIVIAISAFFVFTKPMYEQISGLRAQIASYDQALDNSKTLEQERDKLTSKYNNISVEDREKLKKLLPDNIDNIRLILEIEKIASPYGMALKDVKYDASESKENVATPVGAVKGGAQDSLQNYRVLDMQFSVSGSYKDFLSFTRDLESNLRIVDISSIDFSSEGDAKSNPNQVYKYTYKIKTYWLKN